MRFDDIKEGDVMSLYDAMVIGLKVQYDTYDKGAGYLFFEHSAIKIPRKDCEDVEVLYEAIKMMAYELRTLYSKEYHDNH